MLATTADGPGARSSARRRPDQGGSCPTHQSLGQPGAWANLGEPIRSRQRGSSAQPPLYCEQDAAVESAGPRCTAGAAIDLSSAHSLPQRPLRDQLAIFSGHWAGGDSRQKGCVERAAAQAVGQGPSPPGAHAVCPSCLFEHAGGWRGAQGGQLGPGAQIVYGPASRPSSQANAGWRPAQRPSLDLHGHGHGLRL